MQTILISGQLGVCGSWLQDNLIQELTVDASTSLPSLDTGMGDWFDIVLHKHVETMVVKVPTILIRR